MPTDLPTLNPLRYDPTITVPNPGEPRTIQSIATSPGIGMAGLKNNADWMRSRFDAALRGPMQAVAYEADTGQAAAISSTNVVIHFARLEATTSSKGVWMAATANVYFYSYDGINWHSVDSGALAGSDTAWNEMASDGSRIVLIGDNEVQNTGWAVSWADCTGGVTSGAWRAIVHDGTRFITGNTGGQFSHSTDGQTFSAVINGGTNWLGGPNTPAQIAAGKGPGGVNPRVIAVPSSGDNGVFAASANNGTSWTDISVPPSSVTWHGIAYRETDHLWVAAGSVMGSMGIYASTDGGDTWTHQQSFSGGNGSRLWVMNDHFVMMMGGVLVYAHDVTNWRVGLMSRRYTGGGAAMQVRSFVKGGGRFAWCHAFATANIFAALSQAGDFEDGVAP